MGKVWLIFSLSTKRFFYVEVPNDDKKDYAWICMHILRKLYNDNTICGQQLVDKYDGEMDYNYSHLVSLEKQYDYQKLHKDASVFNDNSNITLYD